MANIVRNNRQKSAQNVKSFSGGQRTEQTTKNQKTKQKKLRL